MFMGEYRVYQLSREHLFLVFTVPRWGVIQDFVTPTYLVLILSVYPPMKWEGIMDLVDQLPVDLAES